MWLAVGWRTTSKVELEDEKNILKEGSGKTYLLHNLSNVEILGVSKWHMLHGQVVCLER